MTSQSFADAEFWLPPGFLTDDDIVMSKDTKDKAISDMEEGFGSNSLFSCEFPSGFSPNLRSPVESLVGSTETESDEEDYLTELTRQVAHSTLEDDFLNNSPMFLSDYHKACGFSGSPQSTLLSAGIGCCCWQGPAKNCHSKVSSPPAVWDLYRAEAGEVAQIRMREESYVYAGGLFAPPTELSHVPVHAKVPNQDGRYNAGRSPFYQNLQAARFEHLKQQIMLKQRRQHLVQSRGMVGSNCRTRSPGLSHAAWPTLQRAHQQQERAVPAMLTMVGSKECAGTGVFLPRLAKSSTPSMGRR